MAGGIRRGAGGQLFCVCNEPVHVLCVRSERSHKPDDTRLPAVVVKDETGGQQAIAEGDWHAAKQYIGLGWGQNFNVFQVPDSVL